MRSQGESTRQLDNSSTDYTDNADRHDERTAPNRNVSGETFCEICVICGSLGSIIRPRITQITQINRTRLSFCSLTGVALGAFELGYVAEIQGMLERTAALVTVGAPESRKCTHTTR